MNQAVQSARGLELLDDDLVQTLLDIGQRAQSYVKGKDFAAFAGDPRLQDALAGCLVGMGLAAGEISEHLRNWLSDVEWDLVEQMSFWRIHHIRSERNQRALWEYAQAALPRVLDALERFRNPATQ